MIDPLTQVVGLLQPRMSLSKLVVGAGAWLVRRSVDGSPFYCTLLSGACRLSIAGREPVPLGRFDFVLVPDAEAFALSSLVPPEDGIESRRVEVSPGIVRVGSPDEPSSARMLVGHCEFGSHDAGLLVSLLPQVVLLRRQHRLTRLVELVDEESRGDRPGREMILDRLLEVMLIEALRSVREAEPPPGLLRGLADERIAVALRRMHERPTEQWTVATLAREAGFSRSSFFERFRREVGVAPMAYLLAWRIALAKDLLRRERIGVSQVAERVGYGSASTFSVAFARHVGMSPMLYARENAEPTRL